MVAGFLITMGTLGDRIGRRKLLLIGAAAFGVLSLLAAFSTSAEMLIVSRALLGIAGATLAPSTLSLIFSMFQDPKQRAVAIGVWISAFSAGSAIGPVLGGVLLEQFWWGSVFLLALPVMVLLLVLGPIVLPEYRDPDAGRLDLASAVMSLVAVLAVIFGLKQIAQDGLGLLPIASIVVGLVVGVVWVRRQLTLADPMIDLRLFRIPSFSASLAINFLAIFVAVGYFLFVAQYLQLVVGLSPLEAGLWSVPSAIGFIVGSNLAPRIVRRVRPAYVMGAGLAIAAAGLGVLTQVGGSDGLAIVVAGSVIISLGLAPVCRSDHRADRRVRAAGARRRRVRDLRDRRRAWRGARDLHPGQHRRRHLPKRRGQRSARGRPRRTPRRSRATRWAELSASRDSFPVSSARPCSRSRERRSCRGCRWLPGSAPSWPSRSPSWRSWSCATCRREPSPVPAVTRRKVDAATPATRIRRSWAQVLPRRERDPRRGPGVDRRVSSPDD